MLILGIESSCDETACALVQDGWRVRSAVTITQNEIHARYQGVVPEVAARAHVESILPVIESTFKSAHCTPADVDAIAVVNRPGLIGSLVVGLTAAKTLSIIYRKPLAAVDHLECHLYADNLSETEPAPRPMTFPFVGLVVSGGHTSLVLVSGWDKFELIGSTCDDAAGEAFDKAAVILGLGYPGGPAIEKAGRQGNRKAYDFPRAMMERGNLDFSFSGLKTAVMYTVRGTPRRKGLEPLADAVRADLAASFQEAVVDTLVTKALRAINQTGVKTLVLGGGVVANSRFREALTETAAAEKIDLRLPARRYCTDNAAMVAGLGYHYAMAGRFETIEVDAQPT